MRPCVFLSVGSAISLVVVMWWTYQTSLLPAAGQYLDMFDLESDHSGADVSHEEQIEAF